MTALQYTAVINSLVSTIGRKHIALIFFSVYEPALILDAPEESLCRVLLRREMKLVFAALIKMSGSLPFLSSVDVFLAKPTACLRACKAGAGAALSFNPDIYMKLLYRFRTERCLPICLRIETCNYYCLPTPIIEKCDERVINNNNNNNNE